MLKTKLTVRVDKGLLENLKRYAAVNKTTLTDLIDSYLRQIPAQAPFDNTPIVRHLSGTLSSDVSLQDYKKHLEEKYAR
jgi:hypothetical protein